MRRGLEALNITDARPKEMGAEGFTAPVMPCADHSGHNKIFIAQWDGTKYVKASDWIEPLKDKAQPLIDEVAKSYATSTTGWPKRTEPCEKSS